MDTSGSSAPPPPTPSPADQQAYKKRNITCYRCGQTGHISANCPNPQSANFKRKRDDAKVANDIRDPFEPGEPWDGEEEEEWPDDDDDYDGYDDEEYDDDEIPETGWLVVEEEALVAVEKNPLYRGCLVVDTGCSCSVSSLKAAELIQLGRVAEEGSVWNEILPSNKTVGFANGQNHKCSLQVTQ